MGKIKKTQLPLADMVLDEEPQRTDRALIGRYDRGGLNVMASVSHSS